MFIAIIDGQIGIPHQLYTMYHRGAYDDLRISTPILDYISDGKLVIPLDQEGACFEDLFAMGGGMKGKKDREYLYSCGSFRGSWLVLDSDACLWHYSAHRRHDEAPIVKSRKPIRWSEKSRLLFPTEELSRDHRDILAGSIAGGISHEGLNALVRHRCLGSMMPMEWFPAAGLIHILTTVSVDRTSWVEDWKETEEGRTFINSLSKHTGVSDASTFNPQPTTSGVIANGEVSSGESTSGELPLPAKPKRKRSYKKRPTPK